MTPAYILALQVIIKCKTCQFQIGNSCAFREKFAPFNCPKCVKGLRTAYSLSRHHREVYKENVMSETKKTIAMQEKNKNCKTMPYASSIAPNLLHFLRPSHPLTSFHHHVQKFDKESS